MTVELEKNWNVCGQILLSRLWVVGFMTHARDQTTATAWTDSVRSYYQSQQGFIISDPLGNCRISYNASRQWKLCKWHKYVLYSWWTFSFQSLLVHHIGSINLLSVPSHLQWIISKCEVEGNIEPSPEWLWMVALLWKLIHEEGIRYYHLYDQMNWAIPDVIAKQKPVASFQVQISLKLTENLTQLQKV